MKLRQLHKELGKLLAKTDAGYGDYRVAVVDRDACPVDAHAVGSVIEVAVDQLYDEDEDKFEPLILLRWE